MGNTFFWGRARGRRPYKSGWGWYFFGGGHGGAAPTNPVGGDFFGGGHAGLFHSTVQFSIFVFSKPLPVSKTGVFNNFWLFSMNYRLKLLRHKASRSQEILE